MTRALFLFGLLLAGCGAPVASSSLWSDGDGGAPDCAGADAQETLATDFGSEQYCRWDCVDLVDAGASEVNLLFDRTSYGWQPPTEVDFPCKETSR